MTALVSLLFITVIPIDCKITNFCFSDKYTVQIKSMLRAREQVNLLKVK